MNETLQKMFEHAMHVGRELGWTAPTAPAQAVSSEYGQSVHGHFSHGNEARDYHVYRPAQLGATPPLILMLHGCQQDGEELARLTRLQHWADQCGCVALYPTQARRANPSGCWNWFAPEHQRADQGEAAWLAALTQDIATRYGADPQRLYVAGLSAGGAMALNLVATHPGLFAAVGVHSGLPYGLAHDQLSALTLMHQGPSGGSAPLRLASSIPLIVFQGDADHRVNPINAASIIEQMLADADPQALRLERTTGRAAGGLEFTHIRYLNIEGEGAARAELWMVHGGGHGWFGGDPATAFAEPKGPDAMAAMMRFFLAEH